MIDKTKSWELRDVKIMALHYGSHRSIARSLCRVRSLQGQVESQPARATSIRRDHNNWTHRESQHLYIFYQMKARLGVPGDWWLWFQRTRREYNARCKLLGGWWMRRPCRVMLWLRLCMLLILLHMSLSSSFFSYQRGSLSPPPSQRQCWWRVTHPNPRPCNTRYTRHPRPGGTHTHTHTHFSAPGRVTWRLWFRFSIECNLEHLQCDIFVWQ